MTRKSANLLSLLALLPLLAACPGIDTLRVTPDHPEDLEALLNQNEYPRIQQLLERHPEFETTGLQGVIASHIDAYEDNTLAQVRAREAEGELRAAITQLDGALSRLPASNRLADYKAALEARRAQRLQENRRRELLVRARYIAELRQVQREQRQLESPGITRRWKYTTSEQEASSLGAELLACGQLALQQDDLDNASACLRMAERINDGPEVQAALTLLASHPDGTLQAREAPTPARPGRLASTARKRTAQPEVMQRLLVQTEQALDRNDLVTARKSFEKLQVEGSDSGEVDALKQRLDTAIKASVKELMYQGDRLYRADKVNEAIITWAQALELDPGNVAVLERLTRARKVLARLEELKNRQTARP